MNAEKFLSGYVYAKENIESIRVRIKELSLMKQTEYESALGAYKINGMPRGGGEDDAVFRSVDKIISVYNQKLAKLTERLACELDKVMDIEDAVNLSGLTPHEEEYIVKRYFENKSVIQIALDMCYSERSLCRIRKTALEKIDAWIVQGLT